MPRKHTERDRALAARSAPKGIRMKLVGTMSTAFLLPGQAGSLSCRSRGLRPERARQNAARGIGRAEDG